jgi:hypothetical protein
LLNDVFGSKIEVDKESYMKRWLSIIAAAGLLLYPFAAIAADYGSQTLQTQQGPPVAQPLVREGDFAIRLAAQLNLGNPTDEATAEDVLATAGVIPANGWLSDYPVTPEIVGQLQESITKAAAEGKLPMNSEEATKGLNYLAAQMSLPIPAEPGSGPPEGQQAPAGTNNPSVVNNYYYNQGPPVMSYYPPPPDYAYMYDWVPYPSWWFGFWFPGFFMCHNFTTVVVSGAVVVNGGVVVVPRQAIVSNRIIDPVTRRVAVVDPVTRTSAGRVRPLTTLRTGNGRTFNTLSDLRRGAGVNSPRTMMPETSTSGTIRTREGFGSPEARRSAERIFTRSVDNTRRTRESIRTLGEGRRYVAPAASGRSWNGAVRGEGMRFNSPAPSGRIYRSPAGGGGERFIAPRDSGRSFNAPVLRQDGGSSRSFIPMSERQFAPQSMPLRTFNAPMSRGGGEVWRSFSGSGQSVRGGQGFYR